MKQIILFLIFVFSTSCAQNAVLSQQNSQAQEIPTPSTSPTPFTFPKLSVAESRRLDERLSQKTRQVLEQADEIEIFDIVMKKFSAAAPQVEPDDFQNYHVRKKAVIRDVNLKQQLLNALFYAVGSKDSGSMCFTPRHGLRAIYKDQRVELVICFQCGNFQGVSSVGKVGGALSDAPKELFEQILANSKEN